MSPDPAPRRVLSSASPGPLVPAAAPPAAMRHVVSARTAVVNPLSLIALVAADLLPLVGVLFLDWQVFPIILLYWLENVVVGAFTLARIGKAEGRGGVPTAASGVSVRLRIGGRSVDAGSMSPRALQGFFCVHYGAFTLAHGILVVTLFGILGSASGGMTGLLGVLSGTVDMGGLEVLRQWWFWVAFAALIVSHGVSYRRNFIGHGEYLVLSPQDVMLQPYGRLVVLHITVLCAGVLVSGLGAPLAGLLLLVVLKTGLDVVTFYREHRRALRRSS